MSNSRPSSPTRRWRKKIGLPIEIRIASASTAQQRRDREQQQRRDQRGRCAYLTANCQPFGSAGRIANSGTPPRCSTLTRSSATSKRRGTSEVVTPSSWQRRTMPSRTLCGARREGEDRRAGRPARRSPPRGSSSRRAPAAAARRPRSRAGRCRGSRPGAARTQAAAAAAGDQVADLAGAHDQRRLAVCRAGSRGPREEEPGPADATASTPR